MSAIDAASSGSALSFALAGLATAGARFDAAASVVASDPSGADLAQAAVDITQSKVAFAASVKVADVADQMQGLLVDLIA